MTLTAEEIAELEAPYQARALAGFGWNSAYRPQMADHLRLMGRSQAEQAASVEGFVRDEPVLMAVLEGIRDLPEGLLVAGAIYNLVWNRLTDRPAAQRHRRYRCLLLRCAGT